MTNSRPSLPANPKLPADFERLVLWAVLLLVFSMAARAPLDSDMWWHLRAGENTVQNLRPLTVDPFSFTRQGETWINHSWLGQVVLFEVFDLFGTPGLSAVVALCAAGSLGMILGLLDGPVLLKAFLTVLAAVVSAPVWTPRPQVFSLLLFAVLIRILILYHRGRIRNLAVLAPLFIMWANLHGGYVIGLILIALVALGELLDNFLDRTDSNSRGLGRIGHLALWGLVGGGVVVLNPNGIQTWLIPFQTVGVGALQSSISEWASPDFHQAAQIPMLALTGLLFVACGFSGKRLSWFEITPLVAFMLAAFYARRNFGPYALVALPVLASHGWLALRDLWTKAAPRLEKALPGWLIPKRAVRTLPPRVTRWVNALILAVLVLAALVKWLGVSLPGVVSGYERELYPKDAVAWLQENRPVGPMLNEYGWGGYLIWRLPEYPVFVDGRTDLYGDEILGQWTQVVNARPGWEDTLARWGIRLVLLPPSWPVTSLLEERGWRLLYQDGQAVLFGR